MSNTQASERPGPYEQLLLALGDSHESRLLINRFATSLAKAVRQAEDAGWPGPLSEVIDPLQHTRESWEALTGCPPALTDTEAPEENTTAVDYVVQSRRSDGTWEPSSRFETDATWAVRQLARHRRHMPQSEHRIAYRTTTITLRPIAARAGQPEAAASMTTSQQYSVPAGSAPTTVVFEPAWEDNPTWSGSELYEDLAVAQVLAADAYTSEMYPVLDEHDDGPSDLVWAEIEGSWELTDGGEDTPVSIERRTVRARPAPAGALPLVQQLALVTEFRVPMPQGTAGGYGEVVVQRDEVGTLWAVTDGAFSGLRAWIDGEGWRHISDVGRAVAYRHTREAALLLAHQVAELEAPCYQAEVAAAAPETDTMPQAVSTREVLVVAERLFREAAGERPLGRGVCEEVLAVVLKALPADEHAGYPARLEEFAQRRRERLAQLYLEFGPDSAIAAHGRYELVGQPVSVVLCELLDARPLWLAGVWDYELPEVWLADIAEAWGSPLP